MVQISEIVEGRHTGKEVEVRGWIYRTRSSGSIVFVVVRDSSDIVQATVIKGEVPEKNFENARRALVESSVIVRGIVAEDERAPNGYEIKVKSFNVVGFAEKFPITKDKSDEFLLDNRHLWLRSREMTATLKVRSEVFNLIREYFQSHGYYEVQSPTFVSGACEGGATLFEVPYFGKTVYLTQSWQLYAEAMIFSLEKIYTIAPSFRAEKSRTRRHLTEFWHAEVESAWSHNEDMMRVGEDFIEFLCHEVMKRRKRELEYLKRDLSKLETVKAPFERIKYAKALEMLNEKGIELKFGDELGYDEEKALTEEFEKPIFITHFPREKGFYHRPDPEEPSTLLCHDMLAPEGYGEIIGGGERVYELKELLERMDEENMDIEPYQWYIDLRRYGTVPHSGFGLGVDRTVAWLTGSEHIKYVVPFPRMMRRVYP